MGLEVLQSIRYHDKTLSSLFFDFDNWKINIVLDYGIDEVETVSLMFYGITNLSIDQIEEFNAANVEYFILYDVSYKHLNDRYFANFNCRFPTNRLNWNLSFAFAEAEVTMI